MQPQQLFVMSGLPGSGKSTIADELAKAMRVPVLSIDPIEAAMWASGLPRSDTGLAAYYVARAIAAENLRLGQTVIIDAVNPVEAAREMWRSLAAEFDLPVTFIEVTCSDEEIHEARINARVRGIPGMSEVTWERVLERKQEFEPWAGKRLQLDTSNQDLESLITQALEYLPL